MPIITPQVYVPDAHLFESRLFFLIGPVRGGGDWQATATTFILGKDPSAYVVCPCRWDATHPLASAFVASNGNPFPRQLNWEQWYIKRAALRHHGGLSGCLLAFLPCESTTNPHPGPEPYAMDTRGEIASWRVLMRVMYARMVLGAEAGFHGLSQIERNFTDELGYSFPIHATLEQTVEAAFKLADMSLHPPRH